MIPNRRLLFSSLPPVLASGHGARFPDPLKVSVPNDEGSLRMGDEGCPNDDATGYSREKEEADSMGCEEAS
jgi:hypothetical protein